MRRLLILMFALIPVSVSASPFAYTGDGSDGWSAGETVTATTFNEIETELDALEAPTYITRTANGTLTGEFAMSALNTGIILNTNVTGTPVIYTGTNCTNQFVRSLNASGAATCATVTTTDLNAAVTLDADTNVHCIDTKQLLAPDPGDAISVYGTNFATTITRYRAYILPITNAGTAAITVRECDAGQQSCGNNDTAYTANSDGAAWDTTLSDAGIAADGNVMFIVNSTTGDLSGGSLNVELCYSRATVVAP